MKCQICSNEMEIISQDVSHNSKTDTKYDRINYVCKKDDVWVKTEIPQKK